MKLSFPTSSVSRRLWLHRGGIFLFHVLLSAYYVLVRDVRIDLPVIGDPASNTWDWYWQLLPMQSLKTDFFESIWHLHAQPPLYNIYGAVIRVFAGDSHLYALHILNILMGGLICVMAFELVRRLTGRIWFAWIVALLVAFNPALVLFEAYPLYSVFTAFLVMLAVFCVVLALPQYKGAGDFVGTRHRRVRLEEPEIPEEVNYRYLILSALVFTLLILTRSSFHLIMLLPIILFLSFLAREHWRKVLLISVCISLLAVGWYAKNAAQSGFFGASSWYGLGMWRIVTYEYPRQQLQDLVEEGVIIPMVTEQEPFNYPAAFKPYGYDKTSEIPTLAMGDFNNINIPDISRVYMDNALKVIRETPRRYFLNVQKAYRFYTCPSNTFEQIQLNADKMQGHVRLWNTWIYGTDTGEAIGRILNRPACSMLYFTLPAGLIFYGGVLLWQGRVSRRRWKTLLWRDGAMVMIAMILSYALLAGILFEISENDRFKFDVEALIFAFLGILVYRTGEWLYTKFTGNKLVGA